MLIKGFQSYPVVLQLRTITKPKYVTLYLERYLKGSNVLKSVHDKTLKNVIETLITDFIAIARVEYEAIKRLRLMILLLMVKCCLNIFTR